MRGRIIGGGNSNDAVRLWDGVNGNNASRLERRLPYIVQTQGTFSVWVKQGESGSAIIASCMESQSLHDLTFYITVSTNNISLMYYDQNLNPAIYGFVQYSMQLDTWYNVIVSYIWRGTSNSSAIDFVIRKANDNVSQQFYQRVISNFQYTPYQQTEYFCINGYSGVTTGTAQVSMFEYFYMGLYMDMSFATNRQKFISDSGRPASLGKNGEKPFNTLPYIYLGGKFDNWNINKGQLLIGGMTLISPTNFTKSPDKPT